MGMPNKIDEHLVFSVCDQLVANGEKVTVREVHHRIGGSLTGVNRWVKAWRERDISNRVTLPERLPETLEQALMREVRGLIDTGIRHHVQALKDVQEGMEDLTKLLETVEGEKQVLQGQFDALRQRHHELEQAYAQQQGQIAVLQQQVQTSQDWQQTATTLTKQNHELEKQLLVYQTKYTD